MLRGYRFPGMDLTSEQRRNLRAWCVYDWATNGYQVTTASALLPVFFVQGIAPEGAVLLGTHVPPTALWGFAIGLAALVVVMMSPLLGAVADFTSLRKEFLTVFACGGSLCASLLFFSSEGTVWFTLLFFVLAHICYTSGNVFYDSFLPQIVPEEWTDRASGRGFAYGYVGGGLQFALALGLLTFHEPIGISQELALRIGLLTAGLWWIGFALYTFLNLKDAPPAVRFEKTASGLRLAVVAGAGRTWRTVKRLPKFPALLLFLVAFLLYNDGIQTVIGISAAYGGSELELTPQTIMLTFLVVQFIAFGGALAFSRLAGKIGAKRAILLALAVWTGAVFYAYFLPAGNRWGFFLLGAVVGLVLGGSQALSRSLFASMIPISAAAGFFGFYSVFNKLSAISGPLLFATLTTLFGSARPAILALGAYFVIGGILLSLVNVEKARASRALWQIDAADPEPEPKAPDGGKE